MFRPITYAPRGRMSHSVATLSASVALGSPMCQPWSSSPRFPRGSSRLWFGPATKPSSEMDMWQVVSDTEPPGLVLVLGGEQQRGERLEGGHELVELVGLEA